MLTAAEFEILDRYVTEGEEPPAIADAMGMRAVDVARIIQDTCKRSRAVARKLLDQQARPALAAANKAQSPLTAPIVKPAKPDPQAEVRMSPAKARNRDRATEVPKRLQEEPLVANATMREAIASVRLDGETIAIDGPVTVEPVSEPDSIRLTISGTAKGVREGIELVAGAVTGDDLDTMDAVHVAALNIPHLRDHAIALGNQAAELRTKVAEHQRHTAKRARLAELEAEMRQLREELGEAA